MNKRCEYITMCRPECIQIDVCIARYISHRTYEHMNGQEEEGERVTKNMYDSEQENVCK